MESDIDYDPKSRIRKLGEIGNVEMNKHIAISRYYRSGLELIRRANAHLTEGDLEYSYVLFMKFITLFVEKVREHPEYANWNAEEKAAVKKYLNTAFSQTETLKNKILQKYEKEYQEYLDNEEKRAKSKKSSAIKPENASIKEESSNSKTRLAELPVLTPTYLLNNALRPIIIPESLIKDFMHLAQLNTDCNIETCALLTGILKKDSFVVKLLLVPQQSGSSDDCTSENDMAVFDIIDSNNLLTLGWIHTHPSQDAFLSSIDMHSQFGYQSMMAEAIAIVCSPRDANKVFRLSDLGMEVIKKCSQKGFHPHHTIPPLFEEARHVQFVDSPLEVIDLR